MYTTYPEMALAHTFYGWTLA